GWVKISGEVTFTEAGTPQFGFKSYDGAGEVYIDDIRLDKVTYVPVYPSSTYTEGIGTFGGDNAMLMADTSNEWWNYGTAVEEGKKYVYAMDVKIENAEADFQFYPYVMNFGDFWQNGPVFNNNTDWQHIEFEFTAAKPDAANGTRFGFSRTGNGTVYLDNITLAEVAEENITSTDLIIGKQTKGENTRIVMKLCADAETIEAYDSVAIKLTVDGVEKTVAVDCVYDSFYNNGALVTAESLNCTYVAILEIGNINTASSVTVQGMYTIGDTVMYGTARVLK
ncbi:MAG: hypothetical protein MJ132_05265, partial [Clostridia bacterium]|nr:hypothetical protein [Clostridia bacterium]